MLLAAIKLQTASTVLLASIFQFLAVIKQETVSTAQLGSTSAPLGTTPRRFASIVTTGHIPACPGAVRLVIVGCALLALQTRTALRPLRARHAQLDAMPLRSLRHAPNVRRAGWTSTQTQLLHARRVLLASTRQLPSRHALPVSLVRLTSIRMPLRHACRAPQGNSPRVEP